MRLNNHLSFYIIQNSGVILSFAGDSYYDWACHITAQSPHKGIKKAILKIMHV
jgi:hypothetical protein